MKKYLLTALVAFSTHFYAHAQESKISQSYVTKTSVVVHPYNVKTQKPDMTMRFLLNDGIKFYVYKVLDNGYVISVWDFRDDKNGSKAKFYNKTLAALKTDASYEFESGSNYYKMTKQQVGIPADQPADANSPFAKFKQLAYVDYWGNNMQFFIPLKDFAEQCDPILPSGSSFTWGFLSLPIKTRFGYSKAPFTFEENINFGLSFGWKWQRSSKIYSAHNLLAGVSVGKVKTDLPEDKIGSAGAMSYSLGYMYQYDIFQVGGFAGIDLVDGSQSSQFKYQGMPWLGIAIGVSLFGEKKTAAAKDLKQDTNK